MNSDQETADKAVEYLNKQKEQSNKMVNQSEQDIEQALQDKGLNAPRLSPTIISETILAEQYYVFPGTTMTICCLTLQNGYNVVGTSAAASPENFDAEIGRRVSKDKAREQIWALEGYLLRHKLSQTKKD